MIDSSSVAAAVESWIKDLGREAVVADPDKIRTYTRSVCASTRKVVAVLLPESHDQVLKIVETANHCGVPLYPISCGKQWGMGSRLPVCDGAAVVELSRMNRILEVSSRFHYAVVEPGVTQRQLLDYIAEHDLPLMLNVTGSTSDTSLIGNAMDRGVGYFDTRANGISNMQVVLGSGKTIRTGFGHYENAATKNLYPYGIGPSLDGLFLQGSFGIVTSACIDLMPKPEGQLCAIIKIHDEARLPKLIDTLVSLRSRGVITTIAHVGNRERSYITLAPLLYEQMIKSGEPEGETTRARAVHLLEKGGFGPWSAAIGILGTRDQMKLAKKEIRRAVSGFAKTMFLDDALIAKAKGLAELLSFFPGIRDQLMMLKAVEPVYGFTAGRATDESLKAVYWSAGDFDHLSASDPDGSNSGLLFCLPIIPAHGETVSKVVHDTRDTFARYGFDAAITVNLMNAKVMEGVVSLAFDRRDPVQTRKAHECIQDMESRYMEQGYPPYRVGINSMHQVVHENDNFWQTVRDIKAVLDPNGIIAPGRYTLS